jgi:hypothetical protein
VSYRVPAHVTYRRVDDEIVLLDERTETYLGLNPTAAIIWEAIAAGGSPATAAEALVVQTTASPAEATADTEALLVECVRLGLLEPDGV